ncbi:DUF1549 domain-containing protein [Lignipirellula cremea]|uniref:Planctomycete cytochrome C n=1 Tax=Lignipirellula cremea TaxID=2528010 RepID=A0A518DLH4_9BACT|nr:DUF1549 domain-containing protein [Lignipirellula cremea]QDU92689.1 Planctomycete cytochrome C [Lignipirellula cremea]
MTKSCHFLIAIGFLFSTGNLWAAEAESDPTTVSAEHRRFFEEQVRPLLAQRCYKCHGPEKQKGDLRLDSRGAMLQGGESGPAIMPGQPDASLLLEAVKYESFEMPPDGQLKENDIAALEQWIRLGAPWPGDQGVVAKVEKGPRITDEDRQFWSFQPVVDYRPPAVEDARFSRQPIDRFVFARLSQAGLQPAPRADRATLIRRAYFDLWGLPPSPEEVAAFVDDPSPDAYAKLVDRLLASPRYGERWGRYWLDLVRYAESDGYKLDSFRPDAWRYRDYVVNAFNADMPYDQFVREQLAGDELAPENPDALTATGFLRHTIYEYNQRDVRTQWDFMVNELTDVTADVFLGIGLSCARCHDHKFDPLLQEDYFRLRAFFTPIMQPDDQPLPLADRAEWEAWKTARAAWESETAAIRAELAAIEEPYKERAGAVQFNKFPLDVQPILRAQPEDRDPLGQQLTLLAMRQVIAAQEKLSFPEKLNAKDRPRWEALTQQLAEFEKQKPAERPLAFCVSDVGPESPPTRIPGQRNAEPIAPGFLTILDPNPAVIEPPAGLASTGRRTALANWITRPDNPLATRVVVNRVWQHHFGQGLTATASDFGRLGEAPSHPQLLDWLTMRFLENGWRWKPLHRLIMLSETYQQQAVVEQPQAMLADPQNRLLWRANIRRLDAEQVRDAMLAVSGELQEKTGGPSVDDGAPRRGIYVKSMRNTRNPLFDVFDGPDGFSSVAQRNTTTTPTQSLLMMNGDWTLKRARKFAQRVAAVGDDPADQVDAAFRLAYGHPPSTSQAIASVDFLASRAQAPSAGPFPTGEIAGRPGQSAHFDLKPARLTAADTSAMPFSDFTLEAVVVLDSVDADAQVRTIASQWNGSPEEPGWSLGVSGQTSDQKSRNLLLEVVGMNDNGDRQHQTLASNLRLTLHTPYYVAVVFRVANADSAGAEFFLRDLSDPQAPLQTARVKHSLIGGYRSDAAFAIGGRDQAQGHGWHGEIDQVRLSRAALSPAGLMAEASDGLSEATGAVAPETPSKTIGWWRFEKDQPLANSAGDRMPLATNAPAPLLPEEQALLDFCHVLLNSNEFLYVD